MIYLKLVVNGKPVTGAGAIVGYEGQIEIESFTWKIKVNHTEEPNGSVRTEKLPKWIHLSKFFDPATPNLCTHMAAKTQFKTATITMLNAVSTGDRDEPTKVMQLTLKDGRIEEIGITASESGKAIALKEKLTLSYATSELNYHPMDVVRMTRGKKAMMFELITPSSKT